MSNNVLTDYVAHGFHQIDESALRLHPPKIKWTPGWHKRSTQSQLQYLEKLANTMNHAAALLQSERDELANLCEKKEQQINQLKAAMDQNLMMLQQEVTHMNQQRQEYHENIKHLNEEIRKLRDGHHD